MKKNIKKWLSICIALLLTLSTIPYVYAQSNDDILVLQKNEDGTYHISDSKFREASEDVVVYSDDGHEIFHDNAKNAFMKVDDSRFQKAIELSISTEDPTTVDSLANTYNLSDRLVEDIKNLLDNATSGDSELSELKIYIPEQSSSAQRSLGLSESGRYVGYNNQTYYQEIMLFKATSNDTNIQNLKPNWDNYLNKVFESTVITIINNATSSTIYAVPWTLLSIFGHDVSKNIDTTCAAVHSAKLSENKYIKYTYLVQNNDYHLGSVIEYTYDYHYTNLLNTDGVGATVSGNTRAMDAGDKVAYVNADEYAYKWYSGFGYYSPVTSYTYKSKDGLIQVRFNSMYHV